MSKETHTRPSTAHIPPFGLRMQPELREALTQAASANGRSLNAEITQRLEHSFSPVQGTQIELHVSGSVRMGVLRDAILLLKGELGLEDVSPDITIDFVSSDKTVLRIVSQADNL